jgi:hypothetical protein
VEAGNHALDNLLEQQLSQETGASRSDDPELDL